MKQREKKAKKTVQRASSVIFPLTESAYAPGWYLPVVKSANEKEQPTNIVKRKKKMKQQENKTNQGFPANGRPNRCLG